MAPSQPCKSWLTGSQDASMASTGTVRRCCGGRSSRSSTRPDHQHRLAGTRLTQHHQTHLLLSRAPSEPFCGIPWHQQTSSASSLATAFRGLEQQQNGQWR